MLLPSRFCSRLSYRRRDVWNPFKTLTERDGVRLRRLERTVEGLCDDVEKVLVLTGKVNARLRQRARRAADLEEDDPSYQSEQTTLPSGSDHDHPASFPLLPRTEGSSETLHRLGSPQYTRDQLRQFAQERGFRQPQLPRTRQ